MSKVLVRQISPISVKKRLTYGRVSSSWPGIQKPPRVATSRWFDSVSESIAADQAAAFASAVGRAERAVAARFSPVAVRSRASSASISARP